MSLRSVSPLFIGTFIHRSNSGAVTVMLGLMLAQLSSHTPTHPITSLQVGLLPVTYFISELTLAPFMGAISDQWGRRKFLIIGPFFGFAQVSLLFFTPAKSPLLYLLCLQILAGVSSAMTVPAGLGYLADFTARHRILRIRVMSFYELVTSGGIAVGTAIAGLLWDRFGHFAFFLIACTYLLVSFCMFLSPAVNQVVERGKLNYVASRYLRILRTPRLLIFIPAWLCICALVGIWLSSQIPFILTRPMHNPQQLLMGSISGPGAGHRVSLIMGGFALLFGLCLLFWAFFLNNIARLRLMFTSIVGVYLACIALFGINHRGPGNDGLLYAWLPVLLIGIFAETSFAPAALAYLADISEEAAKDRGLLMGLYSIFLGLGQILGNGLGGVFAHSFGFDGLIYLTAILAFIALLSLLWLFKQEKVHLA